MRIKNCICYLFKILYVVIFLLEKVMVSNGVELCEIKMLVLYGFLLFSFVLIILRNFLDGEIMWRWLEWELMIIIYWLCELSINLFGFLRGNVLVF